MTVAGRAIQSRHGKFQKACYVCMWQEFTTLTLIPILKGTQGLLLFTNEKRGGQGILTQQGRARRVATVSAELLQLYLPSSWILLQHVGGTLSPLRVQDIDLQLARP